MPHQGENRLNYQIRMRVFLSLHSINGGEIAQQRTILGESIDPVAFLVSMTSRDCSTISP